MPHRFAAALALLLILLAPLTAEGSRENGDGGTGERGKEEIDVPWYGQKERWGDEYLGDSRTITLRTHGCALCCTAMVFRSYGIKTDPEKLNRSLLKQDAFEKGWDDDTGEYLGRVRLIWDKAASTAEEVEAFKRYNFSDAPADLDLIRTFLDKGVPVIAEVLRPGGIPHFVVIRGYRGDDFLIRDPLDKEKEVLSDGYSISDKYGSGAARNIFGIRVFIPAQP